MYGANDWIRPYSNPASRKLAIQEIPHYLCVMAGSSILLNENTMWKLRENQQFEQSRYVEQSTFTVDSAEKNGPITASSINAHRTLHYKRSHTEPVPILPCATSAMLYIHAMKKGDYLSNRPLFLAMLINGTLFTLLRRIHYFLLRHETWRLRMVICTKFAVKNSFNLRRNVSLS